MNKYIIEILKNRSSLILPGIGALIVINKKTGEVKINEHLTFNDGALANFIADKEGIDKTEAQNQVAKFTREIKNQLDKGESYDIFEFGKIFKNDKNEITFEMADQGGETKKADISKVLEEKPKKAEVKKPEVKESKPKEEAEKPKKAPKEKKADVKKEKTEKPKVEKVKEEKKETKVKNTYIPLVKEQKTEVKNEIPDVPKITKTQEPESTTSNSPNSASEKPVETTKEDNEKTVVVVEKKKRKLWPIILILLLILLAVPAYLFKDKIMVMLGLDDHGSQIVNVNNYPDADGDQIPDFADVDITHGKDSDGDGIDDLADLDQTHGKDEDHDGIDDAFAQSAMAAVAEPVEEIVDITALKDENQNEIPDFAEAETTGGNDENGNGIDDSFEFDESDTTQTDENNNGIIDQAEDIAVLGQINQQFEDANENGVPDYADVVLSGGEDVNNNNIDDTFENPENDADKDGIDDGMQMEQAELLSGGTTLPTEEETAVTEEEIIEPAAEETAIAEESQPKEEKVEVKEEEIPETTVATTSTPSSSGSYHIVGGAFENKSNAESYVSKMSQKGFSPHIIGRFDGLHLVALNSYQTRTEASNSLSEAKNHSSGAWIFKH